MYIAPGGNVLDTPRTEGLRVTPAYTCGVEAVAMGKRLGVVRVFGGWSSRFKCADNDLRAPSEPSTRRRRATMDNRVFTSACAKGVVSTWAAHILLIYHYHSIVATTTPCPKVVETSSSRYRWPYRSPRDTCTNFLPGNIKIIIITSYRQYVIILKTTARDFTFVTRGIRICHTYIIIIS